MSGIKTAREAFQRAFKDDPGFRMGYQANIAMLIYDDQTSMKQGRSERPPYDLGKVEGCNAIADKMITMLFERDF